MAPAFVRVCPQSAPRSASRNSNDSGCVSYRHTDDLWFKKRKAKLLGLRFSIRLATEVRCPSKKRSQVLSRLPFKIIALMQRIPDAAARCCTLTRSATTARAISLKKIPCVSTWPIKPKHRRRSIVFPDRTGTGNFTQNKCFTSAVKDENPPACRGSLN